MADSIDLPKLEVWYHQELSRLLTYDVAHLAWKEEKSTNGVSRTWVLG